MRQLNSEEKELTEKGIERLKKEVKELEENLEYNIALKFKEDYLRKFDDKWREVLRNRKDREDNKILKLMETEIKEKKKSIKEMEKHISEGVEEKKPLGVG